jgi:hypothetical protein
MFFGDCHGYDMIMENFTFAYKISGENMPKIKISPVIKSITIALIFFTLGRLLAIRWGNIGFWLAVILLTIFYAALWAVNRHQKS